MSTVDEILASGRYTDRRGRAWEAAYYAPEWMHRVGGIFGERHLHLTPDQMRLLIERDQHRDVCRGLRECADHPVPVVYQNKWTTWPMIAYRRVITHPERNDLPEAMDDARALVVGP